MQSNLFFSAEKPLLLASQSPRRKQLLEQAAIPFTAVNSHSSEAYEASLPMEEIPLAIAKGKIKAVESARLTTLQNRSILAADTVVCIHNQLIGKPANRKAAIDTLQLLSGQTHRVITGVVLKNARAQIAFSESTEVHFYPLSEKDIAFYVDTFQPYDKAGAYAIQEWIGVAGIKSIHGDFYNVMGLPVSRLLHEIALYEKG